MPSEIDTAIFSDFVRLHEPGPITLEAPLVIPLTAAWSFRVHLDGFTATLVTPKNDSTLPNEKPSYFSGPNVVHARGYAEAWAPLIEVFAH